MAEEVLQSMSARVLSSVNSACSTEESWENMKLDICFIPYSKINSSLIRDINIKDKKK